jgi:hypothetical protein
VKEIPTVVSPFLGAFPSYSIPKMTKGVTVHFYIHSSKVTVQYSLYFRLDRLQFYQVLCTDKGISDIPGNDTVDSRAIDFIEEVNIEDTAGREV